MKSDWNCYWGFNICHQHLYWSYESLCDRTSGYAHICIKYINRSFEKKQRYLFCKVCFWLIMIFFRYCVNTCVYALCIYIYHGIIIVNNSTIVLRHFYRGFNFISYVFTILDSEWRNALVFYNLFSTFYRLFCTTPIYSFSHSLPPLFLLLFIINWF
jgi:hypothetical protein